MAKHDRAADPTSVATDETQAQGKAARAPLTDEQRTKMSTAMKEYWATHEHPKKGKTFTEEQKANMRAGQERQRAAKAAEAAATTPTS